MRHKFYQSNTQNKTDKRLTISLILIILSGIVCGSLAYAIVEQNGATGSYFMQNYLEYRLGGSFLQVFCLSFVSSFSLQLIALMMCFCAFGTPVLLLLPLLKGIGIGSVSMYLFAQYSWKGLLINAVMHWIPNVIQCIVLIFFIRLALRYASAIFATFVSKKQPVADISADKGLHTFVISSAILLVTSMLESILCAIFYVVLYI